jgi:ankyrin repeat protein
MKKLFNINADNITVNTKITILALFLIVFVTIKWASYEPQVTLPKNQDNISEPEIISTFTPAPMSDVEYSNSTIGCRTDKILEGLDMGKSPNMRVKNGVTLLMFAVTWDCPTITEILIEHSANINATDNNGWTALMRASGDGNIVILKMLLEAGADINIKEDLNGWIASDIAKDQTVKKILKEYRQTPSSP